MTNQGVNFQLPSEGQFSVAVDIRYGEVRHARSEYLLLTLARRFSG
jgi:hypothetical protein